MKVGDEEALVTVSDDGYLVVEYEGRDVPLEDFKFDLESLVGELGDRFVLSDVVLECSGLSVRKQSWSLMLVVFR